MGCQIFLCLFSTKRCIPTGCLNVYQCQVKILYEAKDEPAPSFTSIRSYPDDHRVKDSLIVVSAPHRITGAQRGRGYFINVEGYPEFQIKPRTKYTLADGIIREEPWSGTDGAHNR